MSGHVQDFQTRARHQADELLQAIATAESIIITTIERECEALRTGRMLAAEALRVRLHDAARLYLHATKAARASLAVLGWLLPGIDKVFEERRAAFANVLQVELAVLAAERAAVKAARQQPTVVRLDRRQASWQSAPRRPAFRVVAGHREEARLAGRTPSRGRS